jgi:metallo-beta-lactamase family protein
MKDPEIVDEADVLLLESTYGDRNHRPLEETIGEFEAVIESASKVKGNILIPSFAVGRTQDLIYWLGRLHRDGRLQRQKVYIDSPMAIQVSDVYERYHKLFNEDDPHFRRFMQGGWDEWLPGLTYTPGPEESMALNRISEGAIIIAGSGMCTGGRILHHLKHNLWRQKTQVVIVGYQAANTLGRALVDGASMVKIFGNEIAVKAQIHTLGGFSAHAGQDQLVEWAENFGTPRPRLYLVHGEPRAMQALQRRFVLNSHWDAHIPSQGEVIQL